MFKSLLLLAALSPVFSDSFEAKASTCWSEVKTVDAVNDTQAAVVVKPSTLVCLDRGVVKYDCEVDALGVCKRETPKPPDPPVGGCTISDPLIKPAGYTGHAVTWERMFLGQVFPYGNAYLSPTGSYTLRSNARGDQGPTMKNKWLQVEFVPQANTTYSIYWLGVQTQTLVPGYTRSRPAKSILVTVSPCAGDLRAPNTFSSDPFLSKCRALRSESTLAFGTKSNAACKLVANQKYYINFAFVDPSNGIEVGETTCDNPDGKCEVNANAPTKP